MPPGKPLLPRIPAAVQRYGLAVLSVAIALGTALFLQLFSFRGVEFPLFLFAIALTVWYAGIRPISAKIRKHLQPGLSSSISFSECGGDLIPARQHRLQRHRRADCRGDPMKGKLEFTPATAKGWLLPAGDSPRGK